MTPSPTRAIRISDEAWERLGAAAKKVGESRAEFLLSAAEDRMAAGPAPRPRQAPAGKVRTGLCVHRNAPGTFCSRGCDT